MPESVPLMLKPIHPELGKSIPWPQQMSDHAAGFDLAAAIDQSTSLEPGARILVPCGFAIAVPQGYEAQVRPRSGLALKHGVTVLNAPGTIDSDYRGEVKVILVNHGSVEFLIEPGLRVAQLVIAAVASIRLERVNELDATVRGAGGFGSTGMG